MYSKFKHLIYAIVSYVHKSLEVYSSNMNAKQKHPGCKKVREAALQIGDQKL